jgi:hypothetical protein
VRILLQSGRDDRDVDRRARDPRSAFAICLLATSCSGAVGSSGIEDRARRDVPIAICHEDLTPSDATPAGTPRPEAYWKAIFPTFGGFEASFDLHSSTCIGDAPTGPVGAPVKLSSSDWGKVAGGANGLEVLWLPVVAPVAARDRGPLAIVQSRASALDVYALGEYEGHRASSTFEVSPMGPGTVVLARDQGCMQGASAADCDSVLAVYVVRAGRILLAATSPLERARYHAGRDGGKVHVRLTTDPPVFDANSMRIKERLSVRDGAEEELRRAEQERLFVLRGDELVPDRESLAP